MDAVDPLPDRKRSRLVPRLTGHVVVESLANTIPLALRPGWPCRARRIRGAWARWLAVGLAAAAMPALAQPFQLPTANHAIWEKGGESRFFAGPAGRTWEGGLFGCVRTGGQQLHEGIDIRCIQRDRQKEPADPVLAAAGGTVAYVNRKSSLSNYGQYLILKHQIDDIEVYTLYAHLREIRSGLGPGDAIAQGEKIAVMGRTSNTSQGISRDLAHLHFEIGLLVNDRFRAWYKANYPTQRDDHGVWNGQNLLGLDPRLIFLFQHARGKSFHLREFIQDQTALCRVLVRDPDFSFVRRYAVLIEPNPTAARLGVAGYEIALNYCGVPIRIIPRASSEFPSAAKYRLLSVNAAEQAKNPCRRLVSRSGSRWVLTSAGTRLLDLLTY